VAKLRDIKRRIKSVKNTAKITHTMELVATAKAKVAQGRIQKAIPYFKALAEIAGEARKSGAEGKSDAPAVLHPLLTKREVKKVTLLGIAANRGLCGGYNGNVIRTLRRRRDELLAQGLQVTLLAVGKKLIAGLKFQQIPFETVQGPMPDDRPPYTDCERIADDLARRFLGGEADRVEVVYTHFFSAGKQAPVVETVLPIETTDQKEEDVKKTASTATADALKPGAQVDFIIEPDPRSILDAIFPLQAKLHVYRVFLEAAASEQIARRVAMKNASDNAGEVGKALRMQYNRARQAGITKEILEIVGGAEALA
jgi:F-type H+-transporting ATPase subunit gamma